MLHSKDQATLVDRDLSSLNTLKNQITIANTHGGLDALSQESVDIMLGTISRRHGLHLSGESLDVDSLVSSLESIQQDCQPEDDQ